MSAGEIYADSWRVTGISMALTVPLGMLWYCVFLSFNVNTTIDLGWSFNQFFVACLCFALRETGAAYAYASASTNNSSSTSSGGGGGSGDPPIRNIICLIVIFVWAARLGGFILIERVCKRENDDRYETMARNLLPKKEGVAGVAVPPAADNAVALPNYGSQPAVSQQPGATQLLSDQLQTSASSEELESVRKKFFFFQFFIQGILIVFPAVPPIYFIFANTQQGDPQMQPAFWVGLVVAVFGVVNAGISDHQLEQYKHEQAELRRQTGATTKGLCRTGWWRKSRHPNLFFELVTWLGFATMALDPSSTPMLISITAFTGPLWLWLIMKYVTVPVTEESMKRSRPDWDTLIADTNMFFVF